jgi:hypothetical protein
MMFVRDTPKFDNDYVQHQLESSILGLNSKSKNKQHAIDHPLIEALRTRFELLLMMFELFQQLLPSVNSLISQNESNPTRTPERFVPDFKKLLIRGTVYNSIMVMVTFSDLEPQYLNASN